MHEGGGRKTRRTTRAPGRTPLSNSKTTHTEHHIHQTPGRSQTPGRFLGTRDQIAEKNFLLFCYRGRLFYLAKVCCVCSTGPCVHVHVILPLPCMTLPRQYSSTV